ncbi:RNA recognition motif domain-containing protein [Cupriavidus basilensis]|uniref:RNA recognition motif domain-containing protein n=1 Tax=Cupriavidus basilensis TaxID=68895 RepID=UPI00157B4AFB|nr:RNA-binding protein [Cupriavidus basilensis]NUA28639.1 RNA-binding protein [Cupriavidus basilensis]
MSMLFVGNIDNGITDEEIKAFLVKYGFPPFDEIEHVPGDGTRPAVTLTFHSLDPESLRKLQPRIHNMFWNGRTVNAHVMTERFG